MRLCIVECHRVGLCLCERALSVSLYVIKVLERMVCARTGSGQSQCWWHGSRDLYSRFELASGLNEVSVRQATGMKTSIG